MKPIPSPPLRAAGTLAALLFASLLVPPAHADLSWRLYSVPRHVLPFSLLDPARRRMLMIGRAEATDEGYVVWSGSLDFPAEPWVPMKTFGTPPVYSLDHSPVDLSGAVVDSVRDRLLVWGGAAVRSEFGVWALSLATGEWTRISSDTAPVKDGSSVVYDPDGDRVLVLCGITAALGTPSGSNQVMQLSLTGIPTWSELSVAGSPPIGRGYAAATFDPSHHRVLMFGGEYVSTSYPFPLIPMDETWELSLSGTPTWRFLPPAGSLPSARYNAFVAADTVQKHVLMTGGIDANG